MVAARPNGSFIPPRLLAYETLSETGWSYADGGDNFHPTVFVDIGAYLPLKLKALECYVSQVRPSPNARSLEAVRALAAYRGHTVNLAAAESFVLIREVVM